MENVLLDVARIDRYSGGLDRPGRRQDLAEPGDIDREHAVDLLARPCRPHPRCQRRVHIELRREPEVAPVHAWLQPSPVPLKIPDHRDLPGCQRLGARRTEYTEVDRSVRGIGGSDFQESARAGTHLGVVGRKHQIGLRPLQDGGDDSGHAGGRGQSLTGID